MAGTALATAGQLAAVTIPTVPVCLFAWAVSGLYHQGGALGFALMSIVRLGVLLVLLFTTPLFIGSTPPALTGLTGMLPFYVAVWLLAPLLDRKDSTYGFVIVVVTRVGATLVLGLYAVGVYGSPGSGWRQLAVSQVAGSLAGVVPLSLHIRMAVVGLMVHGPPPPEKAPALAHDAPGRPNNLEVELPYVHLMHVVRAIKFRASPKLTRPQ